MVTVKSVFQWSYFTIEAIISVPSSAHPSCTACFLPNS